MSRQTWHDWGELEDGAHRCSMCFQTEVGGDRSMVGCKGSPVALRRVVNRGHGHNIQMADVLVDGGPTRPLYYCGTCDAHAPRNARKFAQRCVGMAARGDYGTLCLKQIKKGQKPRYKQFKVTEAKQSQVNEEQFPKPAPPLARGSI